MQWIGRRGSEHVEDRRGMGGRGLAIGGGGGLLALLLAVLFGVNPGGFMGGGTATAPRDEAVEDERARFVSVVLADTEDVWSALFREKLQRRYREPGMVLFRGQVESACGFAGSAVGPFYCPPDAKIYIDLQFFEELARRFGAPGDFAQAYVVAHEVGHHIQNQLGYSARVQEERRRLSEAEGNRLSVRLELQADFLAGVWAHHAQKTKKVLEPGDIEEALRAAAAIGDDRLQRQGRGRVVPDSFTHGTSEQRARWFRRGFETGDLSLLEELFSLPYERL
ncbi:MAG TPA: neutral zinc metallopeptidase [Planctomycetota bacterium]|nr:neutral zinc metallopeptidase [Planctomycetota bacterium]